MSKKMLFLLSVAIVAGLTAVLLLTSRPAGVVKKAYGSPIDAGKAEIVELSSLSAYPTAYYGTKIIVEGQTLQVCKSSGCWMLMTDGENQLFVQFYDFTVNIPSGSPVRVQGELRIQNQVPYLVGEGVELLQ